MTGPAASIRRTAPAARAAPAQPLYSLAKAPSGLPVQGRLSLLFPFRSKMGDFAIFGRKWAILPFSAENGRFCHFRARR